MSWQITWASGRRSRKSQSVPCAGRSRSSRHCASGSLSCGAYTALVSGGFTLFTGPISAAIGFHEHRSNELLLEDGHLVGRVQEPILGREAKRTTLVELRQGLGLSHHETLAVGDGANDLAMLAEAGLGV